MLIISLKKKRYHMLSVPRKKKGELDVGVGKREIRGGTEKRRSPLLRSEGGGGFNRLNLRRKGGAGLATRQGVKGGIAIRGSRGTTVSRKKKGRTDLPWKG